MGIGAINGAITGAAGGAAGGFVGGAGNAWMNGANFADGLNAGLNAAGMGALSGGLLGGLAKGIDVASHGGNFWNGEGATYNLYAKDLRFSGEKHKIMSEYNNKNLRIFSRRYFGRSMETGLRGGSVYKGLFAEKPDGYNVLGDAWTQDGKGAVLGTTTYHTDGSVVNISKAAFASYENLYLTLGHEYIHVQINMNPMYSSDAFRGSQEKVAYAWTEQQASAWDMPTTSAMTHNAFKEFFPNYVNRPSFFHLSPSSIRTVRPW